MTASPLYRSEDVNLPEAGAGARPGQAHRLIALTNDPALIRSLQDLAAGGIDVCVVPNLRSFTDQLLLHAGDTALLDAVALEEPVSQLVDVISRQLPDLRLMVAGHGTEQQQLGARIENQTVFRFVHKPVSSQRLRLFLDAAMRPSSRNTSMAPAPAAATVKKPRPLPATTLRGKGTRQRALIGVIVCIAIAAAWAFWPHGTPEPPAAVVNPATGVQAQVASLLARANQALAAGKFVASDGSSAAELFRAVLKLDAVNRTAGDGYGRAVDQALHHAEELLTAGKLNDASAIVAAVTLLEPGNSRLGVLNTQITRETARQNADASQRQAFEARQAQIRNALASMHDRLQKGALLDPAAGSAVASFHTAETLGPNDSTVGSARETLVSALLAKADTELKAHHLPAARRLVDAASSINSSASGLDALRDRMDEAAAPAVAPEPVKPAPRVEAPAPTSTAPASNAPTSAAPTSAAPAETVATPAAVIAPPTTVAPPTTSAAATDAGNTIVSARTLRLLRSQDPVYPEWALQQRISGWVELDFTLAKDGSVTNIAVVGAEPKNTFNAAAIAALSRYRYAPVVRDGAPVTQRVHIRMRFTAEDAN